MGHPNADLRTPERRNAGPSTHEGGRHQGKKAQRQDGQERQERPNPKRSNARTHERTTMPPQPRRLSQQTPRGEMTADQRSRIDWRAATARTETRTTAPTTMVSPTAGVLTSAGM